MPPRIPLLFGTMTIGTVGKNGVRNSNLKECQEIIDVFFRHGHKEIDTARVYGEGTTEPLLAQLDLKEATLDTKVMPVKPGDHAPTALRSIFRQSLQALAPRKVRTLYLHAPDRTVPFEDTVREINAIHKEGLFEAFGLSNYAAWEVAEIVGICEANGWVKPTIYQVMYNAITRAMETELLPCARKFGLRLVIYNPLAGGFFAGKVSSSDESAATGTRFGVDAGAMAKIYRARYIKDGYFKALELLKGVADRHNLRLTEIALRWCEHHSVLTQEDGIILGASSAAQLEQNCSDCEKGPLPAEVVDALDEAWKIVGVHVPTYWR